MMDEAKASLNLGHVEIGDHEVKAAGVDEAAGVVDVHRCAHDLQFRILAEPGGQSFQHHRVVVNEDYFDFAAVHGFPILSVL